jgi:hypothetical protein
MADNNLKGMRQTYQETGNLGYAGGPGEKKLDAGPSGSKRGIGAKAGLAQGKLKLAGKIGPYNNLRGTSGSLY